MAVRQDASTGEMVGEDDQKKEVVDISKDPTLMHIKVYSPYQVYFDDVATSISGINDTGAFDILKGHHRFLTLLLPCELSIVTEKGDEKIKISRGIMYVKEDRVTVFLDV
jgi:F0F1-type ATP synthase epsilon subunit